ncbi:sensor histidine kinase [Streptomyces sp. TRM68367]|uniref:sensor histidine kinase n=1 Tax=Streptomyces sp. TRM68367 TaxID=2758415 RepID=UPI0021D12ED4|nr:sensor histidine kinase [Streptomyces sp. TRM68367]
MRGEGPGILDDDQARVFGRFWRARAQGGGRDRHAGLGLAIVRQIVESHGGQVRLFSRVGEGSTLVPCARRRTHQRRAARRATRRMNGRSRGPTRPSSPSWRTCPRTPARTAA